MATLCSDKNRCLASQSQINALFMHAYSSSRDSPFKNLRQCKYKANKSSHSKYSTIPGICSDQCLVYMPIRHHETVPLKV
jgi:hypothetical protein